MSTPLTLLLAAAVVVAGLVFLPLSSYTAVYVVMGAMLLGGVLLWRRLRSILGHQAYVAVLAAFVLFAIPLPFVWHGPDDLLIIVALLPIPLGIGLVALFEVEPRFTSPLVLGTLSLAGAFGAVVAGLNDIYVLGLPRADAGNNAIHFADLSMTLGFFSLVGLFGTRSAWRLLFLAGPLCGLEAIVLSGTRGTMLGFAAIALVAGLMLIVWYRSARLWTVGAVVIAAIASAGVLLWIPDTTNRALSAFADTESAVMAFFTKDGQDAPIEGVDPSTDQRLALIHGAIDVFRDHPIFGVGAGQIISAARDYFPERYKNMGNHLHSDLGDFAAAAGVFGLAGYVLLLIAPFLQPPGLYGVERRRAILLGAVILTGSYLTQGLTNAVLGVLPQTALFGTLLACLVAMGRTAQKGEQL